MRFQKFCRWLVNIYKTMLLTIIIFSFCSIVLYALYKDLPLYPISYKTIGWFLAFFFPALSIAYNIARQRVRQKEVINAYRQDKLWDVYFPGKGKEAEFEFENYLWKRLSVFYNRFESAGFSLLAGSFTFIMYFLLARQFGAPLELKSWNFESHNWAVLVGAAFLGSYSGAAVLALRRYRTFDLRPTVFLQINVALIAGTLAGSFLTVLYPHYRVGVLAFIIGFLTSINIRFLSRLMRKTFANLTRVPFPSEIQSDLETVIKNEEAIESLNRISIFSIRELAHADPIPLYFNMPQQSNVIDSMIDQALLHFHFPKIVVQLENVHIQRFTALITRLGVKFDTGGKAMWPGHVDIIDNGGPIDKQLLEASKSIVGSGHHHRILGICHFRYRETHFRS